MAARADVVERYVSRRFARMTDATPDLTEQVLAPGVDLALAQLVFPMVYEELRRMARHALGNEKPGHTLDTISLVHKAYLRLVDSA